MINMIKKLFSVLTALPAFSSLFSKAAKTGRIDPLDALNALSTISSDTKKITDTAMNVATRGGTVSDVAKAVENAGPIEVFGQTIDPKNLTSELRRTGGFCTILANLLDGMKNQTPQEIVEFGEHAQNVSNWKDIIKE